MRKLYSLGFDDDEELMGSGVIMKLSLRLNDQHRAQGKNLTRAKTRAALPLSTPSTS
jgi:hypothetical protein